MPSEIIIEKLISGWAVFGTAVFAPIIYLIFKDILIPQFNHRFFTRYTAQHQDERKALIKFWEKTYLARTALEYINRPEHFDSAHKVRVALDDVNKALDHLELNAILLPDKFVSKYAGHLRSLSATAKTKWEIWNSSELTLEDDRRVIIDLNKTFRTEFEAFRNDLKTNIKKLIGSKR